MGFRVLPPQHFHVIPPEHLQEAKYLWKPTLIWTRTIEAENKDILRRRVTRGSQLLLTLCQHRQGLSQALLLLRLCYEEYSVWDKNDQRHCITQCARSPGLDSSNLRMFRWIKPFLHASCRALNVLARMWVVRSELGNQRQRLDPSIKKSSHVPFTVFVESAASATSRKSTSFASGISPK
jgi:hypothetical protein